MKRRKKKQSNSVVIDLVDTNVQTSTGLTQQLANLTLSPTQPRGAASAGLRCPVENCAMCLSVNGVIQHLERHTKGVLPGSVPRDWLESNNKYVCNCGKLLSKRSRHSHNQRCHAHARLMEAPNTDLPTLAEVASLRRPTLKHVPAMARQAFGRVLQDAISKAIHQNTTDAYIHLLMLPKCVLPTAKRAGKNSHKANIVALCNRWMDGEKVALWRDAERAAIKLQPDKKTVHSDVQKTRDAAIAFAEEGLFGKASRVLCSKGLAPNSDETKRLLAEKHPIQAAPVIPAINSAPVQLGPDFKILDILRSFPKGTACGPSGLRIDHLCEAAEATLPVSFISTLRQFMNHLVSGKAPREVAPVLAGAALVALRKSAPAAQLDIRPIAVGEIYRRLAGKCICAVTSEEARQLFQPHQFGVACPGGMEKVVHKLREVVKEHWNDDDFAILKVDMRNAFNTVSRQAVMDECSKHFPEILPWVIYCYQTHPRLWHVTGEFLSAAGVQQGDPLGPLMFAIALNRLVLEIDEIDDLLLNMWYLDDGVICGTRSSIMRCLACIQQAMEWSGLELNLKKCEIFCRLDLSAFPEEIKKFHQPNLEILGAPIGSNDYCNDYIVSKSQAAEMLLNKLPTLGDPQIAISLLRQCGSFCKLAHLARCCPPDQAQEMLGHFDDAVLSCFEEINAIELSEVARKQAQLGLSCGGIGLRSLKLHAPAAYISSVASSGIIADLKFSIQSYNDQVKVEDKLQIAGNEFPSRWKRQVSLSASIEKKCLSDLLEEAESPSERVRLLEVSSPNASTWLTATPSPGLGFRLEPEEVQVLLKHRLGLPLACTGAKCPLCPENLLDPLGHHALTCKRGPDVIFRHNTIRDTIFNCASRALMNPILEQGANLDHSSSLTRPADVLIPVWSLGKAGAIDVTVAHPLNPLNIDGASATTGYCLEAAELKKHCENDDKCEELGWECLPLAVTPYGSWGIQAMRTIRKIASRLAIQTKQSTEAAQKEIMTRLGIVLARCTARAIIARSPVD